jgi:hypothetical protein
MEPTQGEVTENVPIRYVVHSTVVKVEERFTRDYVDGIGDNARFTERSLGWYVYLQGSYEALHVGASKPAWAFRDRVKITIEKVN